MLGTFDMADILTKKILKKDFYRAAEIADALGVTQGRIRQLRLELHLEPRDFGGIKLHSQEDFQAIANRVAEYKEIHIEFVEAS